MSFCFPFLSFNVRSPGHSCEEEDGNLREAEIKLEQADLNEESFTFIRFVPGPSKFLKFVPASFSHDQPETGAELEDQQKLSEVVDAVEEIQDAGKEEENIAEENEHEEKLEVRARPLDFVLFPSSAHHTYAWHTSV